MDIKDYLAHDGLGLAELAAQGEVSPQELWRTAQTQIEQQNPTYNAVVDTFFDSPASFDVPASWEKLRSGPFAGVPFLLKDLGQYMAGIPTTSGSRLFADDTRDHDSTLVTRYRQAGLMLCGKTNTPELGLATTTEPQLHGPTKNPVSPAHSAGGSSGGAAAAVASGMVPMAHASDGGGSIRIPASCCGLIGLKPTRARVPLGPDALEGWGGLSTTHAITRTVRDSAALLDVCAGEELGSPYYGPPHHRSFRVSAERDPQTLRVGLALDAFSGSPVHPQVKNATLACAAKLENLGHRVVQQTPAIIPELFKDAHGIVAIAHVSAAIEARLATLNRTLRDNDIEAVTRRNYAAGKTLTAAQYAWAQTQMRNEGLTLARYFATGVDVLLTPTMATLPPELGALDMMSDDDTRYLELLYAMIGFTALFNDTGLPAISLPIAKTDNGLPIGVQLVAPMGAEALLLSLAGQMERAALLSVTQPKP